VAGEDGGGAVELFGEDEAREGMGEGEGAEGEKQVGAGAGGVGPAVGRTDGEEDVGPAFIAAGAEPGGEGFGSERAAATVGEDGEGAGAVKGFEERGFGFEDLGLAAGDGGAALEIEGDERVELMFGAGADVGESPLHGGRIARRGWEWGTGRISAVNYQKYAGSSAALHRLGTG
jgi:hypothetical protein